LTDDTIDRAAFRAIFERAGEPIALLAPDGRILGANPALATLLGYRANELEGQIIDDLCVADDVDALSAPAADLLHRASARADGEMRIDRCFRTRAGRDLCRAITFVPIQTGAATQMGLAIIEDVGALRETERALEESEALARYLLDSAWDLISVLDSTGTILLASPSFETVLGFRPDELVGRDALELVAPADRERVAENFARPVQGGKPVPSKCHLLHRDGHEVAAEAIATAVRDEEGRVRQVLAIARDVSERTRAEQALLASEQRSRVLMEQASDGIVVTDGDGKILEANPMLCELLGFSAAELLSMNVRDLIATEHVEGRLVDFAKVRSGKALLLERPLRRKDGAVVEVEVSTKALDDGRVQAIVRDMQERKQLESELLEARKLEAMGRLAAGVAHDFNNILTAILGYGELLADALGENSDAAGDARELTRAAERGRALVRQLLTFGRQHVLELVALDLGQVVRDGEPLLRQLLGSHIHLVVRCENGLPPVRSDAAQLEQALFNVASNARDAMPRGGTLLVEVTQASLDDAYARARPACRPGRYVSLSISDTGAGMDEATRSRIFEPFFTTKAASGGSGLGLSMVYGIVKQSDGYVWVYSEPGHGTTFRIYLPAATRHRRARPAPRERGLFPAGSETLLVAEDDASVRTVVRDLLVPRGYTVLEAADGQEASALLQRHDGPIHLLLCDVVMPAGGGSALARRARELRGGQTRVIYMSGYARELLVSTGALTRRAAFIQKPFTRQTLLGEIRRVLDDPRGPRRQTPARR
jgi:PAS domain S-box-containing protein